MNWDVEKDVRLHHVTKIFCCHFPHSSPPLPPLAVQVWMRVMHDVLHVVPSETTLIISEPPFNPNLLREYMDQMVFEEFGFHSYACCLAPSLAARSFSSSFPESVLARTG